MAKVIKDDIIAAGIDKKVKGILEPKIGIMAYNLTKILLTGYIRELLREAEEN